MTKKKIWMIVVSVILVAAVIAGVFLFSGKPEPVAVYPWGIVGYTDFFMSGGESSGLVTTDKVQSLFLSETQKVTEILVQQGQEVKEGDVLITYDTTLSDLALERKDLEIQQMEMTLKNAYSELEKIKGMKPMVITQPPETQPNPEKVDHSKSPADPKKLNTSYDGDGKTSLTPYYFWLSEKTQIDESMISYLMGDANFIYVVFQIAPEDKPNMPYQYEYGIKYTKASVVTPNPAEPTTPTAPTEPNPTVPVDPSETTAPPTPTETTAPPESSETTAPPESSETTAPSESSEAPAPAARTLTEEPTETTQPTAPVPETEPAPQPTEPPVQPTPTPGTASGYLMSFFTPGQEDVAPGPDIDWNSGYSQTEINSMRKEKEAQITQLEYDIKMGKSELNIMKKEAADGEVRAEFDGTVASVLEPESALSSHQPVVKVNGGGGFYVEGTVGELDLSTIKVGQKVSVNSWENGQTYEGEIVSIGQYPSDEQNFYSPSGANQTYYPYRVFIDQSANLMEGSYVGLTYKTAAAEGGVQSIQNAFIRSDGAGSYVYLRNDEGLLEKRVIQAGVSRDGFYTPIYGGVTEADMIAFPYGKNVKEGAPTFEGSEQDLFG